MKLLYKKFKYKHFNKHKIEKSKRSCRRKKLKQHKYAFEVEQHNRLLSNSEVVKFPENLYLADACGNIFSLIAEAEGKDDVILDFSQTKRIDIGSAVYIKAFVDNQNNNGKKCQIECLSTNRKMREILQHVNIKNYGLNITYPDIKCWEVRIWQKGDKVNYGGVMMKEILPKVLKNKIPSNEFSDIAASLQEILSNCSEHAYSENDEYKNYYLIAGEYENLYKKSNLFTFCIVDRGQGFRASLEKKSFFYRLQASLGLKTDSDLLRAAVEGRMTSVKGGGEIAGRGTGLSYAVESIRNIGGSFYAYSDKGYYEIRRQIDENIEKKERKFAIKGSIIEMMLPINKCRNIL